MVDHIACMNILCYFADILGLLHDYPIKQGESDVRLFCQNMCGL